MNKNTKNSLFFILKQLNIIITKHDIMAAIPSSSAAIASSAVIASSAEVTKASSSATVTTASSVEFVIKIASLRVGITSYVVAS